MSTKQVGPIHFEDYSGAAFERLVFAFHLRTDRWRSIEWYGQVGSDLGRDILGIRDDDSPSGEVVCIQCANHRNLPTAKVIGDIEKARSSTTPPRKMRFVCGGAISATLRDRIAKHAAKIGIPVELWSGVEFEERLRHQAASLLRRFVEGEEFPELPAKLGEFLGKLDAPSDEEISALLASLFDRPAYYTPFRHESCIHAFRDALDDTICALGTGVRRTRSGVALPPIPARHELRGELVREKFAEIERGVAGLRARFDQLVKSKEIRPCAERCGRPDCPVYEMSDAAIRDMDEIRGRLLDAVRHVVPRFSVRVEW
jgi:hypothetical protein